MTLGQSRHVSVQDIIEVGRSAESLGFDSLWIPETWGADSVSILALLASATNRIGLASGVFNVYSRSAALIAQTAATLQEVSGGRFLLGLGVSGPNVVERWHGLEYAAPLERTRDYVEIIRLALGGQRVDYAGSRLQLEGFKLGNPPARQVPIYVASLGPRNVYLTGQIADGWLPIFVPRRGFSELKGQLEAGARSVGRDPSQIQIAAYVPAVVGPRGDRLLREQLAYYLGGMGTFYARYMSRLGFGSQVEAIRSRWIAGDRKGAVEAVSPEILERCTLTAEPEEAVRQLAAYAEDGIHTVVVSLPNGASRAEVDATLQALSGVLGAGQGRDFMSYNPA